ncbi:MAG: diguanylate cyclase [Pseudomonadota bacterium]
MSDTEDWKRRYLEEARDWEASEQRLRRGLARVAMAAEGTSESLDRALELVQRAAKGGSGTDLDSAVDEVSRVIRGMDAAPSSADPAPADSGGDARSFSTQLIDALQLPDERRSELHKFRERIPELGPERCLTELAGAMSSLLRPEPQADSAVSAAQGGAVAGDVKAVLLALIDEVAVVQPGLSSLKTVRETLLREGSGDWHTILSRIIAEIRSIIQRISSDKQALEALVEEVSEELGDITGVLQSDLLGLQSGREQSERLHEVMDAGVSRIQEQIDSESDIDRLKEAVSQSLDGIKTAINDFTDGDAERLAEAEARNEELRDRVERMEEESAQLQQRLQQNREQLMRDTLTGVRSRLAYDESLAQEFSRFRRYQEAFCLAVLDIDHFKNVNDTYGHSAGDKALQLVAKQISDRVRETDLLFRVGGEEFVLLLPRTPLAAAQPIVEAVRGAVGTSAFHFEGKPVSITMSAGVTAVREDDTTETIYARADDAMYRSKKGGRDQLTALA